MLPKKLLKKIDTSNWLLKGEIIYDIMFPVTGQCSIPEGALGGELP
jgi:hypothetical protein